MKKIQNLLFIGFVVIFAVLVTSCAPTHVQTTQQYMGGHLPRPQQIIVYNFAVSPNDIKLNQGLGARLINDLSSTPISQKQLEVANAVSDSLASQLVIQLQALGLPAVRGTRSQPSATTGNVLVIAGSFLDINEGNRLRRMVIGFGVGGTEVATHVELFHFLAHPPLIYAFNTAAKSSVKPGMGPMIGVGAAAGHVVTSAVLSGGINIAGEALGASVKDDATRTAKKIVKNLVPFFKQQNWIH